MQRRRLRRSGEPSQAARRLAHLAQVSRLRRHGTLLVPTRRTRHLAARIDNASRSQQEAASVLLRGPGAPGQDDESRSEEALSARQGVPQAADAGAQGDTAAMNAEWKSAR